jgi:hypothetical protein
LKITTPLQNLLNLDAVPATHRLSYYSHQIDDFPAETVAAGLQHTMDIPKVEREMERPTWGNRVTGTTRKLIAQGITDPFVLAASVIAGIRAGKIVPPKNGRILFDVIKACLMSGKLRALGCRDFREAGKYDPVCGRFGKVAFMAIDPACAGWPALTGILLPSTIFATSG